MDETNAIVDFVSNDGNLSSEEGRALVNDTEVSVIKDAATDPFVMGVLVAHANKSTDPHLRRKLFKALD